MNAALHAQQVIVLLADGARADVMMDMAARGELPYIREHLIERGSLFAAVTAFPSTTGPAYLPFLTGCYPGRCNVPGIRWLDKRFFGTGCSWIKQHRSYVGIESYMMGRDIAPPARTVFEMVPGSYNIFNAITRGADGGRNLTSYSRIWYWYYAHLTDRWSFIDQAARDKVLDACRRGFRYLFAVLPGVDEYSHLAHPHHESTLNAYRFLDQAVGEIVEEQRRFGKWENTQLWIVSDHGLSRTHTHFCLNGFLEQHDLAPFFYPLIAKRRGRKSATMVSGNGMAHLYFRNDSGWQQPMTRTTLEKTHPRLLPDLLHREAVDVLACRADDGWVEVLSKRGEARLKVDDGCVQYEVLGNDPFGFEPMPQRLSVDESLAMTIETDYPDALFALGQLFESPRTGDVVVSATPGFDLRLKYEHPEHRGSHGSLHREHMRVPLLCSQPLNTEHPVRTGDVFSTTLASLGHAVPSWVQGKVLAAR